MRYEISSLAIRSYRNKKLVTTDWVSRGLRRLRRSVRRMDKVFYGG